jgi:endonuclease-8
MPEGDAIHHAARRIAEALIGHEIVEIATPHPRHGHERWPERLGGRAVRRVDAHGKHLFLRFEGNLTLHSHLRMTGSWDVYGRGQRWGRSPRRAWLVLRTGEREVVQFDGPILELMTDSRARFDQRIAELGPDLIADDFDERVYLRRLREDDYTRGVGDALLDQRNIAGIGNVWKSEGCFLAGVDPWRRLRDVSDEELRHLVRELRPLMRLSSERGGRIVSYRPRRHGSRRRRSSPDEEGTWVYDREGRPCRRCGDRVLAHGQGDDNRTTFWCPQCQA